jgi:hypothetical protein
MVEDGDLTHQIQRTTIWDLGLAKIPWGSRIGTWQVKGVPTYPSLASSAALLESLGNHGLFETTNQKTSLEHL